MSDGERGVRRTAWLGALLVIIAAAVPAIAVELGAADAVQGEAADALIHLRNADRPAPNSVLLVALDEQTAQVEGRPPISRSVYARAIRRLDAAGAKAVAIDVQFTEASPRSGHDLDHDGLDDAEDADLDLIEAIEDTKVPVVLATSQAIHRRIDGKGPVVADSDVLGGRANLAPAGAVAAHSAIPLGDGDAARQIGPTNDGLPTFSAATARAAGGPTVPASGMLIDPTVPGWRLHRRSLADVVSTSKLPDDELGKLVRGRVAVIGSTIVGGSADDRTADDRLVLAGSSDIVFGVEVQAQAIATALAGAPLSAAPGLTWALGALSLLVSLIATFRRRLVAELAWFAGGLVVIGIVAWIAVRSGLLLDPVLPWLVLLFGGGAGIAYRVTVERRARAAARGTLSRFVPPGVVDELLREGSDGRIAPHAEIATVMFCDLRGYTALTASLSRPEALVDVLDAYLGTVSRVVLAHGGTVVSFQGDGVMTAFGVPVDDGQAAARAVAAARELLTEALPELRTSLVETLGDGPARELALGIGIATGPVFAGTVGPPARREYAVVGPTTNLAARLQARTKEESGPVLVDDATAAAVMGDGRAAAHTGVRTPEGPLVPVGPREIRGLTRAIDCWTLAS